MSPRKKKIAPAAPETPVTRTPGTNKSSATKRPKLYTPSQVAAIYSVDPKTVSRWAAGGKIDSVVTPAGTHRIPDHVLHSSGVCRKCETLKTAQGACECTANG
jgi:hypothetical protein